uniref:Sushi domain-containing protein n=1 Tax=Seriola dumerili TaxID=41447 RepID=A0A3B4VEZ1_SERDU
MDGYPFRTCNNGEWTGQMRCLSNEAMNNRNIRFRFSYDNKKYSTHGDEMEFMCARGRPVRTVAMRQLCRDACSKLPDVPHANIDYKEGDVIGFTCESGYTSAQASKYVCTSDGWLTVSQGKCYSCSTLPDVPHAHVSEETKKSEYQEGDVIHFTCETGYTSSPTIKYVCSSEGWLAVRRGKCSSSASSCDRPPTDGGVTVNGLPQNDDPILPDHVLMFSCDGPGKYLNGSSVLTCGQDGQWDNPFPSCIGKDQFDSVKNLHIKIGDQLTEGQKLRFYCPLRGQTLRGTAEVECLANGQWSHPFPTCGAHFDCGRPPPLDNGDLKESQRNQYRNNERVEYVCQNYHIMDGYPFRTCNNGEWTGQMRCLKPCTVDSEAMNNRNIRFRFSYDNKKYSTHGDEMEFMCARGRPVRTVAMRQLCRDGVIDLPSCQ